MLDKIERKTQTFRLEEATIDDLHHAIRDGRTTCVAVVQHYIARVRALAKGCCEGWLARNSHAAKAG